MSNIKTQIDSIQFRLKHSLLSYDKLLFFLQYIYSKNIKVHSMFRNEFKREVTFFLSNFEAKLKIMHLYSSKTLIIEFYGLYQYSKCGTPIDSLQIVLNLLEELFNHYPKLTLPISRVDICYDSTTPILTTKKRTLLKWQRNTYQLDKITYHPTSITWGTKKTRFKIVAYDKTVKNNLDVQIYRLEISIKEAYKKLVPINGLLDLISYCSLLQSEFEETLLIEDNKPLFHPINSYETLKYA